MSLERKVTRLEAENESLRDRVTILEELLYGDMDEPLPAEWRLTKCEDKLFRALISRPISNVYYLLTASSKDYVAEDLPNTQVVNVRIMHMRRKLAPFGISILNHWGRGYSLDDATRETFKAIVRRAA